MLAVHLPWWSTWARSTPSAPGPVGGRRGRAGRGPGPPHRRPRRPPRPSATPSEILGADLPRAVGQLRRRCRRAGRPGRRSANCISFNALAEPDAGPDPRSLLRDGLRPAVGVDRIRHSAFAIAGDHPAAASAACCRSACRPAPARARATPASRPNSGGQSQAPCNGPDSGNFGTIDITLLRQRGPRHHQELRQRRRPDRPHPEQHRRRAATTSSASTPATETIDSVACTTVTPLPNAARTETGNLSGAVECGLLSGDQFSDGDPARLQRRDANLFGGTGRLRGRSAATWSTTTACGRSSRRRSPPGSVPVVTCPVSCQRNQFVDASGVPTDGQPARRGRGPT